MTDTKPPSGPAFPALADPDLVPVHPNPDVPPEAPKRAGPDTADPATLARVLREDAAGMHLEAAASDPRGDCSGGHADPTYFFAKVARDLLAAAAAVEKTIPKPVATAESPKSPPADKPKK